MPRPPEAFRSAPSASPEDRRPHSPAPALPFLATPPLSAQPVWNLPLCSHPLLSVPKPSRESTLPRPSVPRHSGSFLSTLAVVRPEFWNLLEPSGTLAAACPRGDLPEPLEFSGQSSSPQPAPAQRSGVCDLLLHLPTILQVPRSSGTFRRVWRTPTQQRFGSTTSAGALEEPSGGEPKGRGRRRPAWKGSPIGLEPLSSRATHTF